MKPENLGEYRGHRVTLDWRAGGIEELRIAWTDWLLSIDEQAEYPALPAVAGANFAVKEVD